MSRRPWLASCLLLVFASAPARAQDVPAPPPAYGSTSMGIDLVLEPLATAAEADVASGAIALALARTQTVIAETPASSTVHVRAEGLSLLARERLGGAAPGTVDTDAAFAPLVTAASEDVSGGRFDLGRARLAWVLAHVPPASALALRARAVQAALDARAGSAATPSVATTTPMVTAAPVATTPQVYVTPTSSGWAVPTTTPAPVDDGHRPHRRQDAEMIDLYITSGLMGAYFGAWITETSGALSGSSSDDESRILTIAMVAGAGVLTLCTFGLDQIDDGPRSGQPTSIAVGMRFGFVLGGLTLGALSAENTYTTGEAFHMMGIGVVGGTALGTIFAYAAEPHPSQVQFTQTSGIWGGMLGAELGALIAPLAFPNSGASDERMVAGFGLTLGGMSAGLLAGIAVSAAHEHFSSRRSWLSTLGMVGGSGAGTLIWLLVSLATRGNFDLPTWGALAGSFGIGGFVLATLLTSGDHGPRSWDEGDAATQVQLSIAPTMGGATMGVSGAF